MTFSEMYAKIPSVTRGKLLLRAKAIMKRKFMTVVMSLVRVDKNRI